MILLELLKKSDNQDLHHFNYSEKHHAFSFFTDETQTELIDFDLSVAKTLVQYFQSCQSYPPYLSWCILDHIDEYDSENGNAFVEKHLFDFKLNDDDNFLVKLFEQINCRVIESEISYSIVDKNDNMILHAAPFYEALVHYLFKANMIDQETLTNILKDIDFKGLRT